MGIKASDKLSDRDIVMYALYLLGGWHHRVHTEDVALKCFELAPSKFSWVEYPQYPDLAPARFALEAIKKPENGALVKGESERKRSAESIGGWMLTVAGTKWVDVNKSRIEKRLGEHIPTGDRLAADRKLRELSDSVAFKKYTMHGEQAHISYTEFVESLICTVNTRPDVIKDRLDQLYSTAERLGRKEVENYLDFCRKKFGALLGDGGEEHA